MDSRSKSPLSLLRSAPRADLLTGFLPSGAFELVGSHLPGELLLEGERTPGTARFDLLGPQPQQQQISHEGDRYRPLDARRIFGNLRLAQAHHPLQRFCRKLNNNRLLSTLCCSFVSYTFQYMVWSGKFATEPG